MKGAHRLRKGRVGEAFDIASPTLPQWATYTKNRNPNFKIHKTKGQALNALSNQMPYSDCLVLEYSQQRMQWVIYIDYTKPDVCERCGGPFAFQRNTYSSGREMTLEHADVANYLRDVICNVCYVADQIDNTMDRGEACAPPNSLLGTPAFDRLMQISPEHKKKWNFIVERYHEYKKQRGMV